MSENRVFFTFLFYALAEVICLSISEPLYGQNDSLPEDPLFLKEIVITDLRSSTKAASASSISTIDDPGSKHLGGVAEMLSTVPGFFSDPSIGEVYTRVFSRGVSLSAEDDIGWYYTSLQEDGLPISAVQYQYFTPDLFLRPDLSFDKAEVIKGGKSGILAQNGPGGIVNFISRTPGESYESHHKITGGLHEGGRLYSRLEGFLGGPIGKSSWDYDLSYLYRYDRGKRETDYPWGNGGQMKLGIQKRFDDGLISVRAKWLDDKVNRYTGVAALDWNNPMPAFGQSFQTTSLLPPDLDTRSDNSSLEPPLLNPKNGIQTKEIAIHTLADFQLGDWRLMNRLKFTNKKVMWKTAIGGQPLGLDNFLTYFISGDPFPAGLVEFKSTRSGEILALVNNVESFNVFQGLPPSFEYVQGSLPNNAVMGSGAWDKDDSINEWMNEIRLSRKFDNLDIGGGIFLSHSNVNIFTNASFIYTTYENDPRALQVTLVNPGEPAKALSDPFGLSNYGALFYQGADIGVNQISIFTDLALDLTSRILVNLGLRYENIAHDGKKDRFGSLEREGGQDGNLLTSYDNSTLMKTGEDPIDFTYNYLSYSLGGNYQLSDDSYAFFRYSRGHKGPELNYYITNFANQTIPQAGEIQEISQLEAGIKSSGFLNLSLTAFYSRLSNVPFSEFIFDDQSNQIFYTPTQFNQTKTLGLEIEWIHDITDYLILNLSGTWQNPKLDKYTLYNASETIDPGDDFTVDYSKNIIPHQPMIMGQASVQYHISSLSANVMWRYTGSRYGNAENSFEMSPFSTIHAGIYYDIQESMGVFLRADNLFNSAGIINFFGPNEFGGNASQASLEYINANPNASFVVFPILPRTIYLGFSLRFHK